MSYQPENPSSDLGFDAQAWLAREFQAIKDALSLLNQPLGRGGLITRTATTMPNIAIGAWETVPFDTGQSPTPIKITQDPANNRFSIDEVGEWFFTFYITFECNKDASNDRIINWRIYNETTGAPYSPDPFPIHVENNANYGHSSASVLVTVTDAIAGNWFRAELGGSARAFNNIELEKAGIVIVEIQAGD